MSAFILAAKNNDEVSGVICPFASSWHTEILDGNVKVVFRKKKLTTVIPEWLYVYISSPVSAITARLPINSAGAMSVDDALKLTTEGCLSDEELRKYAGLKNDLFVIRVGEVQIATTPVSSSVLSEEYGYFPSPNFVRLSNIGVNTIDGLAGFYPKD